MTRKIFGTSLSALVAVAEFSATENVVWVQNSRFVGGHFSGLTLGELRLDLGMVAQEPFSGLNAVEVFSDHPPVRQDGLPFVGIANQWLSQRGEEFVEIPVLISRYGTKMSDYLVADSLDILRLLDESSKSKITDEILRLKMAESDQISRHPRNKRYSQEYLRLSFETMSDLLFGKTFYSELIAPWLDRLNPNLAANLPARDHRSAWVPLYYPETILGVISNQVSPTELKRPFRVPKDSSIAMMVDRLIASIDNSRVEVILDESRSISPSPGDILLTSTSETFVLLGKEFSSNYEQKFIVPIVIAIFQYDMWVSNELIMNIIEKKEGPYRICVRNLNDEKVSTNITIEFGSTFEGSTENEILGKSLDALRQINVNAVYSRFIIKRLSIKIPYGNSRFEIENDANLAIESIREFKMHGYPIDFGSSALNDQILLGLWSVNAARNQTSTI